MFSYLTTISVANENHTPHAIMIANVNNTASVQAADGIYPEKAQQPNPANTPAPSNPTKEDFMKLVAQEMAHSLLGKEDDDAYDGEDDEVLMKALQAKLKKTQDKDGKPSSGSRRTSRRRSSTKRTKSSKKDSKTATVGHDGAVVDHSYLAEMYYAQMNGDSAPTAISNVQDYEIKLTGGNCSDQDKDDDDSFAGGDLDALVSPSQRSKRSSTGSTTASTSGSTVSGNASCTSVTSSEDLDVEELRRFVMSSIPQAVRDQIPEAAWGEIFQPESAGASKTSSKGNKRRASNASNKTPQAITDGDVDDDDLSQLSEITGFTNVFPDGRRVDSKQQTMIDVEADAENASGALSTLSEDERLINKLAPLAPGEASVRSGRHSVASESERNSLAASTTEKVSKVIKAAPPSGDATKRVSFSEVNLRYYERILTDNPAVQSGPAIGIGWRYKRAGSFEVDWFEQGRGMSRSSEQLVLSRQKREKILLDNGFTQKEIAEMVRQIVKVKNQRKTTINNLSAQGVEEAVESAKKKVGRLLSFGKSKDLIRS